jgi:hypothetical protein
MRDKVLETGVYCPTCNCIIKDEELAAWECGQCEPDLSNWEFIEVVMRSKGNWSTV